MSKCFITGVEMNISNAYILDISAAHRAMRNMRQRMATLERLTQQLSPHDDAEVYDVRQNKHVTRKFRRLVSAQVAAALSAACPEETMFLSWDEWTARNRKIMAKYRKAPKPDKATKPATLDSAANEPCDSGVEQKEKYHATCA